MGKRIFTCSLFLLLILSISCEIGLGSAVDTSAPEVTINMPAAGAVVRDEFAISGTWDDDATIKNISVELRSISSKKSEALKLEGEFTGNTNGNERTWKAVVDPFSKNKPLTDGTYEITVTVYDNGGHSTSASRQFVVDNTPPLVVLQRPSTPGKGLTFDSYGQTFTLTGQGADDNNIDHIDVLIYEDPELTKLVNTITLNNVPPTIELDVAKFGEDDYTKIYGSKEKVGEKNLYCAIAAYDDAQRFPVDGSNQSTADLNGNCSVIYYLYDDLQLDSELKNYKITELYHVMNGTYETDSSRSVVYSGILNALKKYEITDGQFTLNPANNPTFTTSKPGLSEVDYSTLDISDEEQGFYITNGSDFTIEANPGLDNLPVVLPAIDEETGLSPVYVLECDTKGNVLSNNKADRIYLPEKYEEKDDKKTRKESGSTKKVSVYIDTEKTPKLRTGKCYVFGIDGADSNGNAIVPKASDAEGNPSNYGFYLATSGNPPTLKILTPVDQIAYLKGNSNFEVSGYAITDDGAPALKIYKDDNSNAPIATKSFVLEDGVEVVDANGIKSSKRRYDFTFTVPKSEFNQTQSNSYAFTVDAANGDKHTSSMKTVMYDVEAPEIKINTVEPVIKTYEGAAGASKNKYTVTENGVTKTKAYEYINGEISIRGTVLETFTSIPAGGITWRVNQNNKVVAGIGGVLDQTLEFTLDTSKLQDQTITTIDIVANDKVGNEKIESKTYFVDQSTDKPVIAPNNTKLLTFDYKQPKDIKYNPNAINKFSSGSSLYAKVSDDDGIKQVEFDVNGLSYDSNYDNATAVSADKDKLAAEVRHEVLKDLGDPTETMVGHQMPNVSGYYRVKITVTDIYNNKSEQVFVVQMTGTAPDVTVTNNTDYIRSTDEVSITTVMNGQPPYTVTILQDDGTENWKQTSSTDLPESGTISGLTREGDVYTYTQSIPLIANPNSHEIKVQVLDGTSGTTTRTVKYSIDNTKPNVAITSPAYDVEASGTNSVSGDSYVFIGSVKDPAATNESVSGIANLYYAFTQTSGVPAKGNSAWLSQKPSTSTWNINMNLKSGITGTDNETLSEGKYYLHVYAVDNAGNECDVITKAFFVDKVAPKFNSIKIVGEESELNESKENYFNQKSDKYKLSGIVTDTFGVASLKVNGTTVTPDSLGKWTTNDISIPRTDESFDVNIVATDKAGRITSLTYKLFCDTVAPDIQITAPETDLEGENSLSGTSYTFRGSSDDVGSGIKVTKYKFVSTPFANNAAAIESAKKVEDAWSSTTGISFTSSKTLVESYSASPANELEEGKWYLYVYSVDAVGNENVISKYFWIDKKTPVLTLAAVDSMTNNSVVIKSTALSDANGIESVTLTLDGKVLTSSGFVAAGDGVIAKNIQSDIATGLTYTTNKTKAVGKTADLTEGNHEFVVTAKDTAGKTTEKTISVLIDTVAPAGALAVTTTAAAGGWYNVKNLSVELDNIVEAGSGIKSVEMKSYDSTVLEANRNFTEGLTPLYKQGDKYTGTIKELSEGQNTIFVIVKDNAGNEKIIPQVVNVDSAAPVLAGIKHGTNSLSENSTYYYNTDSTDFTITGTVTEALSGYQTFTINGENVLAVLPAASASATDWSKTITVTKNASKEITIYVEDKAGNKDQKKYTIFNDTGKPTLTITGPSENLSGDDSLSGDSYTFRANADDDGTGVTAKGIKYLFRQTAFANNAAIITSATDASNTDGWIETNKASFTATKKLVDTYSLTPADELKEGKWYLYVYAEDKSGNQAVDSKYFWIDKNAPTLTLASVNSITSDSVVIKSTALSDANGIESVTLTLDGKVLTSSGFVAAGDGVIAKNIQSDIATGLTYTTDKTKAVGKTADLTEGNHEFVVTVKDTAGKVTSKDIDVFVDTVAPTGTLTVTTTAAAGGWYNVKNLSVELGSIDETGSGIKSVEMKSYDSTVLEANRDFTTGLTTLYKQGDKYTGTIKGLSEGENTIFVIVKDNAGNEKSIPQVVNVDSAAPVLAGIRHGTNSLSEGSIYYYNTDSTNFTITGTVTEALSGYQTFTINGEDIFGVLPAASASAKDWSKTITVSKNDSKEITIYVEDKAGNKDQKKYTIFNDTGNPTIEITSPAQNLTGENSLSGGTYTFRANADDIGTGVSASGIKYLFRQTAFADNAAIITSATNASNTDGWTVTSKTSFAENKKLVDNYSATPAPIDELKEGNWYLYVYAEDKSGNQAVDSKYFWIDKNEPVLTLASVDSITSDSVVIKSTALSDANGIDSVTLTLDGKVLTASGFVPAANGIGAKNIKTDIATGLTYTTDKTKAVGKTAALSDGTHTFVVTATDNAGKSTSKTIEVLVDTAAPVGLLELASTGKTFTTGGNTFPLYNSETVSLTVRLVEPKLWNDVKAEANATSTYYTDSACTTLATGSTGNDTTVYKYIEDASGVDSVMAEIVTAYDQSKLEPLTKRTANSKVYYEGRLTVSAQGENKIFVVVKDNADFTSYFTTSGSSTTSVSSSIYVDSKAPARIKVYDYVADNTDYSTQTEIKQKTVNGNSAITLVVKPEDDGTYGTGIDTVVYKYGDNAADEISATRLATGSEYFKVNVKKNNDNNDGKTYQPDGNVTFVVTDKAGKTANFDFAYQMDNVAPDLKVADIVDADLDATNVDINKNFTISGTASDLSGIDRVIIKYAVEDTATKTINWNTIDSAHTITATGTTSWSHTFDTTDKTVVGESGGKAVDKKYLYLQVIAYDVAGNDKVYTYKDSSDNDVNQFVLYINQDSDRPVISFTNITLSAADTIWLSSSTLTGVVSDDDGVKTLKYKDVQGKSASEIEAMSWTPLTVSNGSWKITNIVDGPHNYYFQVEDKVQAEFNALPANASNKQYFETNGSNTASTLNQPKLMGETGASSDSIATGTTGSAAVSFKMDKTSPKYINSSVMYSTGKVLSYKWSTVKTEQNATDIYYTDAACTTKATSSTGDSITVYKKWTTNSSELEFGGIYTKFSMKLKAYDENFVDTMTVEFNGNTKNGQIITTGSETAEQAKATGISEATAREWIFEDIPVASSLNGPERISLTINDKSNKIPKEDSFTITVDNTAPVIDFTNYSDGADVYGTDAVAVRGSVNSNDLENWYYYVTKESSGVTKGTIGTTNSLIPAGASAGTSFTIVFDGGTTTDTEIHTSNLFNKILEEYDIPLNGEATELAALQKDDTPRDMYIWVWGKDKAGNESEPVSLHLNVIPNGDKPSVRITYPTGKGSKLGGVIRVTGGAEINTSAIRGVYVQIDPDPIVTYEADGTTVKSVAFQNTDTLTKTNPTWLTNLNSAITGASSTFARCYTKETVYALDSDGNTTSTVLIKDALKTSGSKTSWNITLNQNNELDSANFVAIRVFAVSDTNKVSEIANTYFEMDVEAPKIGSATQLQLVQFEEGSEGDFSKIIARQNYESDMWIKGKWFLIGSVEDDGSGIKQISYRDNSADTPVTKYLVQVTDTINKIGEINTNTTTGTDTDKAPYYTQTGKTEKKWYVQKRTTTFPVGLKNAEGKEIDASGNVVGDGAGNIADGKTQATKNNYNYDLCIPIVTQADKVGRLEYVIRATEASGDLYAEQTVTLKYDNKAPLSVLTTGAALNATTTSAKFENEVASALSIVQSSGNYTLYGVVDEPTGDDKVSQSGFSRVAFYFTRNYNGVTQVIDPMQSNGSTGRDNFIPVTDFDVNASTKANNHSDGLYWYKYENATITDTDTINIPLESGKELPKAIRNGGLAKVNGVYYKINTEAISDVDYAAGKVVLAATLQDTTDSEKVTAYFAAAQIVDNITTETGSTSAFNYSTIPAASEDYNDSDHDQMIEMVNSSGTTYTWKAQIDSSLILDGEVDIHVVAMDAAGNVTVGSSRTPANTTYKGNVRNNAPRLYGVKYGTDVNGDGAIIGSEWITDYDKKYSILISKGADANDPSDDVYAYGYEGDVVSESNAKRTITIPENKRITLKGLTKVVPQLVGGNVGLAYTYTYNSDTEDNVVYPATGTPKVKTYTGVGHNTGLRSDDLTIDITVKNFLDQNIKAGDQTLVFNVWDKTDGKTPGTDSFKATINLPVKVSVKDSQKPVVFFMPFHWNTASDNSLYNNKQKYGHIELEKDWKTSKGYTTYTAASNSDKENLKYLDGDPKVSGKISFDATAIDNVIVNEIYASVTDYDPDGEGTATAGSQFKIAYRTADGSWTSAHRKTDSRADMQHDWEFQLVDDSYEEDGTNIVKFKFHLNTERIDSVAHEDVSVAFEVKDRGAATSVTKTEDKIISAKYSEVKNDDSYIWYTTNTEGVLSVPATSSTANDTTVYHKFSGVEQIVYTPKTSDSDYIEEAKYKDVKADTTTTYYTTKSADGTLSVAANSSTTDDATVYAKRNKTYKVDVVPYITELVTTLSKLEKKNGSVYGRTALGKYPVYYHGVSDNGSSKVEKVQVNGFNLKDGTITLSGTNATATLDDDLKFDIPSAAESGEIYVTVNSVPSLNNENNDDSTGGYTDDDSAETLYENYQHYYNRQPNNINNDNLTDNIELAVWGINSRVARSSSAGLDEVVMHVNPADGKLGFAFTHGAERVSYPNGSSNSYEQWNWGWTSVNTVEFIYDAKGNMFGTQAGTDTYTPNKKASRYRLVSSLWGTTWNGSDAMDDANTCYAATNALRLEYQGYGVGDSFVANPKRFFNPKLASSIPSDNNNYTNLYMLYYDDILNELRLRAGSISHYSSVETPSSKFKKSPSRFGDFFDDASIETAATTAYSTEYAHTSVLSSSSTAAGPSKYYAIGVVPGNKTNSYTANLAKAIEGSITNSNSRWTLKNTSEINTYATWANNKVFLLNSNKQRVGIATLGNKNNNGYFDISGISYDKKNASDKYTLSDVKYVSIVDASYDTDTVVAVWFDVIKKALYYSYLENPMANNHNNVDSTSHVNSSWSTPVAILAEGTAGGYCDVVVDDDGHIHIASFSTEDSGSLIYTYLDNYKSNFDSSKNSVIVDSYGTTGWYLSMEVAKNSSGQNIPYISYYMTSMQKPKYTYLVDTEAVTYEQKEGEEADTSWYPKAGADSYSMYTGAWESVMLPIQSDIVLDDINIGVYRYAEADSDGHIKGQIREIPEVAKTAAEIEAGPGQYTDTAGGNGTANPILAYGISYLGTGYVETAQLK